MFLFVLWPMEKCFLSRNGFLAAVPQVATRNTFHAAILPVLYPLLITPSCVHRSCPSTREELCIPDSQTRAARLTFPPHLLLRSPQFVSCHLLFGFPRPTDLLLDSTSARGRRSESSLSLRRGWEKRLFLGGGLKAEGLFSLPSQCL